MNNTLRDLNNHLFAELERLSDESVRGVELDEEIRRADAVCAVSAQIIANGLLTVRAMEFKDKQLSADYKLPRFLEVSE